MSTQTDLDLISGILGEIHFIEARLREGELNSRLEKLKEFLEPVSRDGIFERDSLMDARRKLRQLRVDIDLVIPTKVKIIEDNKD